MSALLPFLQIDHEPSLANYFMPHQIHWIMADHAIHSQRRQAVALAEKSIRIGWTYADAFKNVRKRLHFKKRDYLFATKDYPSALEFMRLCKEVAELFNLTRSILSHGESSLKIPRRRNIALSEERLAGRRRQNSFTDDTRVGVIKFDNGSRIIAFSSSPQAMAVYGGDVGLDEFAKHPNARLLWETAQGRVAGGYDLAVWSAHDGQDTLFHEFAREARAISGPWNLYYRVTLPDAIEFGLLDIINRSRGTTFTPEQFIADCRSRARDEEIFQQAYMCNPHGASDSHIADFSVIERCRADYEISRLHLEHDQILQHFGQFNPDEAADRERIIREFIKRAFKPIFNANETWRLGFDVAASGQGGLAAIYIDRLKGDELWLDGLFTCRTEDWHFLKTVLFCLLDFLPNVKAAGDQTGLGRQICWEAHNRFPWKFTQVNFSSKKHDLGFLLMNQLATAQKRFPRSHQDIASDIFALRKACHASRWIFSESPNPLNKDSHCDIAWAAALASHAHHENPYGCEAQVIVG